MTTYAMEMRGATEAERFLALLANGKRLQIMRRLLEGETSVGSLADAVSLSQSALSQHLARMRTAGVVVTRRDAQTIYYSAKSDKAAKLIAFVDRHFPA